MRVEVVRVYAENAPRRTAWAVMEDGEAVDYRNTKAEAVAVAQRSRTWAKKNTADLRGLLEEAVSECSVKVFTYGESSMAARLARMKVSTYTEELRKRTRNEAD